MQKSRKKILRTVSTQRWIRFGIRDRLARMLHNPDTAISEKFEVDFFGKKYQGDFSTFLDWSTYYFGAYCVEELELMRDALKHELNTTVLDIGANIGHHSLFASTIANHVHAFEPFPKVFSQIEEKIEKNGIDNITIHRIGLGSSNAEMPYSPPKDCNSGTGSFIAKQIVSNEIINLPIRRGDDYFESIGLGAITLIKIDVEGFERFVFQGISETLQKKRPIVFFEWSEESIEENLDIKTTFPEDYLFFDFASDRNLLGLFAVPGYRLLGYTDNSAGNKVALPKEKLSLFQGRIKSRKSNE